MAGAVNGASPGSRSAANTALAESVYAASNFLSGRNEALAILRFDWPRREMRGVMSLITFFDGVIAVIANALIVTFVSSFLAIVVFGHVLLVAAVWPDLTGKRRKPSQESDTEPARVVPRPN